MRKVVGINFRIKIRGVIKKVIHIFCLPSLSVFCGTASEGLVGWDEKVGEGRWFDVQHRVEVRAVFASASTFSVHLHRFFHVHTCKGFDIPTLTLSFIHAILFHHVLSFLSFTLIHPLRTTSELSLSAMRTDENVINVGRNVSAEEGERGGEEVCKDIVDGEERWWQGGRECTRTQALRGWEGFWRRRERAGGGWVGKRSG